MIVRTATEKDIRQFRTKVDREVSSNLELYSEVDVNRMRNDDWFLQRFYERSANDEDAFEWVLGTMHWKKNVGVHDRKDDEFAKEFYEINGMEILGHNNENNLVVWGTSKYTRDFSEFRTEIKMFIIHEMEYLDCEAGRNGMFLVSDSKYAGLFSIDLEISRFTSDILEKHYPGLLRQMLVFNLSMVLDPLFRVILGFMGEETRKTVIVVDKKTIFKYLDKAFIPVEYGGYRQDKLIRVPNCSISYLDLKSENLTQSQIKRYKKLLEKIQ